MNAPEIQIQRMTRDQAILVMQALYAFLKTEIHPDANQDPWVFKMMNTLDDLSVTGLQVMFEVSDDYAAEAEKEAA